MRRCSKCGRTKADADFPNSMNKTLWCKACKAAAERERRRSGRARESERKRTATRSKTEQYREYQRNYNRRRRAVDPEFVEKAREYSRRYYNSRKGRDQRKRQHLRRVYGLTVEQYEAIIEHQGGVCAICLGDPTPTRQGHLFHVDHDHETGEVRGILCQACNHLLGWSRDDVSVLEAAIVYLTSPPARTALEG